MLTLDAATILPFFVDGLFFDNHVIYLPARLYMSAGKR